MAKAQATAAQLRAACEVLKGRPKSSADDPDGFMASFFKSSRLHFIGSWKARIEQLMMEEQGAGPAPVKVAPGAAAAAQAKARLLLGPKAAAAAAAAAGAAGGGGGAPPSRAIIHVDMDCFFAAVAAIGRPEFAGEQLVLRTKTAPAAATSTWCVMADVSAHSSTPLPLPNLAIC
jgi:DNA repair protein REV1